MNYWVIYGTIRNHNSLQTYECHSIILNRNLSLWGKRRVFYNYRSRHLGLTPTLPTAPKPTAFCSIPSILAAMSQFWSRENNFFSAIYKGLSITCLKLQKFQLEISETIWSKTGLERGEDITRRNCVHYFVELERWVNVQTGSKVYCYTNHQIT